MDRGDFVDFKTFTAQNFNGDEEKAHQHLANESYYGDYSLTGSRENLQMILDTMTKEEAKEYMHCFRQSVKKDKVTTKDEHKKPNKWLLIFPAFFLVCAIWLFVTGCSNILQINNLKETGILVQVTVTDKNVKNEGENLVSYYTFTYEYDGKVYNFTDSPDKEYDIGATFDIHIDPNNPEVLVMSSSDLAFAFLLLLFSGASVFLYEKSRFLAKYIPHALSGWAVLMLLTGILLPNTTACVLGSLFLTVILVIRILLYTRKRTAK